MSNKNYDSTFCGSLPLHKINLIQPHGVLLVLKYEDFSILQVSENVEELLQIKAAELTTRPFNTIISDSQIKDIQQKFNTPVRQKLPYTLLLKTAGQEQQYLSLIHRKEDLLLIEIELRPLQPGSKASFTDIYLDIKQAMAAMDHATDIPTICTIAAQEIRRIAGFDKVMIYQFDRDWNGTVIAELIGEGVPLDSYLGLTFPASDIPKQVRDLYLKNPYRLIPERDAKPVGMYPVINPHTQNFLDLSDTDIRAVAGVHIEYMKNMNIIASMSTRIIKDDQLWGLISSHHCTARHLSFETCAVLELLSTIFSARVTSLLNKEKFNAQAARQEVFAKLVEQIYRSGDLVEGLTSHSTTILDMLAASGAVILSEKRIDTIGETPSKNQIRELAMWVYSNNITKLYHQDSLSGVFEDAAAYADVASGMVVLPLNPDKREYIMAFRPEVERSISWGGDPATAITFEKDGVGYHPRNSFAIWKQTVKNTSLAWKSYELEMAESFRNFVLEYMLKKSPF